MAFTDRVEFTKEMKKEGYTILAPNMAPIHFRLFENLFASYGYNVEILQTRGRQIVDEGLNMSTTIPATRRCSPSAR